jgi:hypothetical protein
MPTGDDSRLPGPPTGLARLFVRYLVGFSVGVAIGLAPFLGVLPVPGFRALLDLFPQQLKDDLIPLSAFLLGVVVVAVQFYAGEALSRPRLKRLFRLALIGILAGFFLFVVIHRWFVVTVPFGDDRHAAFAVSWQRSERCDCNASEGKEYLDDQECIRQLSFDPAGVEHCWGSGRLRFVTTALTLPYLVLTSGLGLLVGLLLLQREARRRESAARRRSPRRRRRAPARGEPVD